MKLKDYLDRKLVNSKVELFQLGEASLSPAHLQWLRDPHISKFFEFRFNEHPEETLLQFVRDCEASPNKLLLGIRRVDTGQYIGNIKLSWEPHHGVGDISLMIGEIASWGRGYATHAISLVCEIGFACVGLRKIVAGAYASNVGSVRAFERNGFQMEATLADHVVQDGNIDSVCLMRLFQSEYMAKRTPAGKASNVLEASEKEWSAWVAAALEKSELNAVFRHTQPQAWAQVWQSLTYQPVNYQASSIDYQQQYYRGAGWAMQDLSMVMLHDGRPCGIWPITLGRNNGKTTVSTAGAALMPPLLMQSLGAKSVKTIYTKALHFLQALCEQLQIPMPTMQWPADPQTAAAGLSEWQQQLLRHGVLSIDRHELFVDLGPTMAEIRNTFRKSYKSLINKGLALFDNQVLEGKQLSPAIWSEFKNLHLEVAGRKTRCDTTWDQQYEMVQTGVAFLVTVRDRDSGRLVGAGFFQHTRDEGQYAVAAYDRNLFDQPIGHAVQQLAIEKMKAMGLKWYKIGERRYLQEMPPPTSKEIAIGEFKHGFASHVFMRQEYKWPVREMRGTN